MPAYGNPNVAAPFRPAVWLPLPPNPALLVGPYQVGSVVADVSVGSWRDQLGSATNEYVAIKDVLSIPSDLTYVQSTPRFDPNGVFGVTSFGVATFGTTVAADSATFSLAVFQTPQSGPITLTYRYGKDFVGGRKATLTVELLQGATVIQGWNHADMPAGFTEVSQDVTANITDYTALRVRFTFSEM